MKNEKKNQEQKKEKKEEKEKQYFAAKSLQNVNTCQHNFSDFYEIQQSWHHSLQNC